MADMRISGNNSNGGNDDDDNYRPIIAVVLHNVLRYMTENRLFHIIPIHFTATSFRLGFQVEGHQRWMQQINTRTPQQPINQSINQSVHQLHTHHKQQPPPVSTDQHRARRSSNQLLGFYASIHRPQSNQSSSAHPSSFTHNIHHNDDEIFGKSCHLDRDSNDLPLVDFFG
mmetsp:Transcript_5796/g.17249  ORF Transcript_5796/g.17249 Transcript_5796/m.17249 type:complete len:171 (+) Transcript_5796:861-1373(+)